METCRRWRIPSGKKSKDSKHRVTLGSEWGVLTAAEPQEDKKTEKSSICAEKDLHGCKKRLLLVEKDRKLSALRLDSSISHRPIRYTLKDGQNSQQQLQSLSQFSASHLRMFAKEIWLFSTDFFAGRQTRFTNELNNKTKTEYEKYEAEETNGFNQKAEFIFSDRVQQ